MSARVLLIALLPLALAACRGTGHKIKAEEMDPSWDKRPFGRVLVLAAYEDRA